MGNSLEGVFSDMFTVKGPEGELPYIGKVARRYFNETTAFLKLAPHAQINAVVSLTDSYAWGQGEYTIELKAAPITDALHYRIEGSPVVIQAKGVLPAETDLRDYRNCNQQQQNQIISAHQAGAGQANAARSNLNTQDSSLQRTWFGTFDSTRFGTLRTCFNNIQSCLRDYQNYDCRGPQCSNNVYAYVFPGDATRRIYVCQVFWNIPGERAETIVHEASHFNPVCRTNDFTYGRQNCQNLARNNPGNAVRNADNVCYFGADA